MSAQEMTLSERADACIAALDEAGQATARRVLLRLVGAGDERGDMPPQSAAALGIGDDAGRVAAIVRCLVDGGLVAVDGEGRIALADEQLRSWPVLQGWVATHGKAEQLRYQLEIEAAGWSQRAAQGIGEVGLLDNKQLGEVAACLGPEVRRDIGLSAAAESFIAASQAAAGPRWWPWRNATGSALAVMLILAILATPITLLLIVVLAAFTIHRFGLFG